MLQSAAATDRAIDDLPRGHPPNTGHAFASPIHGLLQKYFGDMSRDWAFFLWLTVLGGSYVLLIALLVLADVAYTTPATVYQMFGRPEIRYATSLTIISCTISAVLSLWVAIPLGYSLARYRFPGRSLVDAIVDVPIVLPPLVLGLSLLILFHLPLGGHKLDDVIARWTGVSVTYAVPAVILAQFAVACSFAVRTMRVTFEQIDPRAEQVARTLGCSRGQAFFRVALPQAHRGAIAAFTVAWARSLGEFGPILVFAGATRMKTEVLSTTVFLELSIGNLESAVAVSLVMVAIALCVLVLLRWLRLEVPA